MKNNSRVIVALDLSSVDKHILRAIEQLNKPLGMETVYFLHVMPDFTIPENVDVAFQKLFAPDQPVDEKIRDRIREVVAEELKALTDLETMVDVIEGKPYQKIVHWIDVKDAELLVLGNKEKSEGSGVTARRVARHASSNILFVPDRKIDEVRRILVPLDLSENSARAVETALHLKKRKPEILVDVLYIVDMPPADYYVGAAKDSGLRRVLKDSAKRAYERFVAEFELDSHALKPHFLENEYSNIAAQIQEFAVEKRPDMVIMGAQGHSAIETFIFGSVTEKLVDMNNQQLVLVVR